MGREQEVAAVRALLLREDVGLVTLTGPGGTGKTRVGLQVAAELLDLFPEGVFFVDLSPIRDPDLVASTIARALALRETWGRTLVESLKIYLGQRQMLLLLDNFEQLLPAAPLVADLLAAAPRLKVLVTSRAALRLRGEHELPVPPLALPDLHPLSSPEALSQYAALELFIQRATAVKPDFAVTADNAAAVAEICTRLDGLPLAIELAAARIKLLGPEALLARLSRRLELLTGGARDLPARQQTLRGTIAWSYELLKETEKILFRRLSVFAGGATLEAVETVCDPEGELETDILDGMASLVDNSLVQLEEQQESGPRVRLLETIREFGQERLLGSGEAALLRRRHARFFRALTDQKSENVWAGDQPAWLRQVARERDNLRAALTGAVESGELDLALQMAGPLSQFWLVCSHFAEGRQRLAALLALPGGEQITRAAALLGAAKLANFQGDVAAGRPLLEESLAIAREVGDRLLLADGLGMLGDGIDACEEALAVAREVGGPNRIGWALHSLGIAKLEGESAAAAVPLLEECLTITREHGYPQLNGYALHALGRAAYEQGEYAAAGARHAESLAIFAELGDRSAVSASLAGLARVAAAQGQPERVLRLVGAAAAQAAAIGIPLFSLRLDLEHAMELARQSLGQAAAETAWAEGQALSLEAVIRYALGSDPTSPGSGG